METARIIFVGMNNWEIIDNVGVIYSGTEEDMRNRFRQMADGEVRHEWTGDLKLVEVHETTR